MKPIRIGKPYTVTDHGRAVTRVTVWFPDGTREAMTTIRAAWAIIHGRPSKGYVVYPLNGNPLDLTPENLACVPRAEFARRIGKIVGESKSAGSRKGWEARRYARRARAAQVYVDHKPYPLAG